MAAIRLQAVTKQFGAQIVLDSVSLDLHPGETVGLVGPNGAGKTTLFRIMAGEFPPDLGTVTRARGLEIGYLKQEPELSGDRSLLDEVGSVFADLLALEKKLHVLAEQISAKAHHPELPALMEAYERVNGQFLSAGGHNFETRLNECLGGLGFSQADYQLPISVLSGGQKCRAALAKLLLQDRQYLLLDEPTNHLDIDAVAWLEKFMIGHRGGAAVISHDRYLLDRLCSRIIEVDRRGVRSYPGNYSNYAETKQRLELTQQRQFTNDAAFIAKERAFIAKHLAGQRTKEAQGRRTRLERRMSAGEFVTDAPRKSRVANLTFKEVESREGTVLRCDELSMAFGENVLFSNLSFQVHAGDRLGITGPNGTGKTTLLKAILGDQMPTNGTIWMDPKRQRGYYAQEAARLDPNRTILEEIQASCPQLGEPTARSLLGAFRFTGDNVFKPLGLLSGGEQSRVRLITLITAQPELLFLDEPTNHLDIASREVLEESLQDFGGTLVVVSHDRYFLDRIVNRLMVLRSGVATIHSGNYSSYRELLERERSLVAAAEIKPVSKRKSPTRKENNASKTASKFDHLTLEQIESMIVEREIELAGLHARFGAAEVYKNPELLSELQDESDRVETELTELNEAWLGRG